MPVSEVTGDLPKILGNEEHLYEGNLIFYFQILFFKSHGQVIGACAYKLAWQRVA